MKSNIFIPKTINVGYQNRGDTYTGKLAYVIYYDEKGKLRKETSWNSWRDKDIPNDEFENVPTEGFVLNKKVGGDRYSWNPRQTYTRVYDPRGFEFEITIPNLLYILENTNSIKGKGIEGEFVYGWDGKDLVLMPVDSPDYKELVKFNSIIYDNKTIKAKDLIVGATYLGKNNMNYVYMGKFDKYQSCYWKNGHCFENETKMIEWCEKNNIYERKTGYRGYYWKEDEIKPGNIGKQFCFYYIGKDYKGNPIDYFFWGKTISKKFIGIVDKNCCENYADLFEKLEHQKEYSPVDDSKYAYFPFDFEDFKKEFTWVYDEYKQEFSYKTGCFLAEDKDGVIYEYYLSKGMSDRTKNSYILYQYESLDSCERIEVLNIFPTKETYNKFSKQNEIHMIPVTLEEIFEKMKPVYRQKYLENGKEYRRETF